MNQGKNTLKGLQTQKAKIDSRISLKKIEISSLQRELNEMEKSKRRIEEMISSFSEKQELIVSEHAILRYLERVKEMDLDKIISEIKSEKIMSLYNALGGSGKYPSRNFSIVVKDNVIVTIET